MANNPFFSCIKPGKRFTYNLESSKDSPLPGRYRPLQSKNVNMQGSNNDSPRAKRRKTEDDKWDDDDDDFVLTQENIAELDKMTRAAFTGQKTTHTDPGPSTTPLSLHPVVKPPSAPTFTHKTSTPAGRLTFKPPLCSGVSDISLPHNSDSSSSRNSRSTIYPSSLSTGRRSTSLSSRENSSRSGSEEIPFQPPNRKPSLPSTISSSTSSESLGMRSPISEGMREEFEMYKNQCDLLKAEMESIKQELYVKEGENKILRDKLTEKDAELSASKQQKLKVTEQQVKEQSQKEKQLRAEIQSLNTQLQFKERDLAEMREKCRNLETLMSASGDSEVPSTSYHSPKVRKVVVSPKGKRSGFPSTKSFMAEEGSQQSKPSIREESVMKDVATSANITDEAKKKGRSRNFQFKLQSSNGIVTGNHLLSKLSEASLQGSCQGSSPDRGLMGLLQTNPPSMDLQAFLFDRDSSNLLSPIPTKRMSDKKVVTTDRPKPRPIVSANSYSKAMEGLHNILSCSNQSPLLSLLDLSHSNLSSNQSENSLQTLEPSSESQSGLFFVSLLNDYLSHYIEMMNCYVERGQSLLSPQSSSSSSFGPSSSLDSSTGSLTSSLNVLLRDGAAYANTLESQALCALNILHKLVLYCDAVRDTLLYSDDVLSDSSISSFGKVEEEMDTDNPPSSLSSLTGSDSGVDSLRQSVLDCRLLAKVFRLANPGKASNEKGEPNKYNEWVVYKALKIIKVLCEKCRDDQLTQLLPVLRKGVLSNCLRCASTPIVVLGGLEVMCSLAKHEKAVLAACSCPGHCVFLPMYQLCSSPVSTLTEEFLVEFAAKVLRCLTSTGSHSKAGLNLLLDMECSSQLQKAVVLLLHKVLLQYQTNQSPNAKRVLQKGTLLLHNLSQVDGQFEEHHYIVQHQYVELISGLNSMFKPTDYENERCAVAELWYFGRDDSDSSQEDEDEMEIS
ncbi:ATR-interacting protein-like isoform X2 [Ostrea edulis]|uniref:ATR-interacting protein-like isoform X2 n=1 Tax=Ostrea edulis TaxID=37623 RepID=UPI0024AF757D|nr:ATR-interacting protein-like isoform X2 [Ostrea edulis]